MGFEFSCSRLRGWCLGFGGSGFRVLFKAKGWGFWVFGLGFGGIGV